VFFAVAVLVVYVGLGLIDVAHFPQVLMLVLYLAVAAVALFLLRVGLQLALLHDQSWQIYTATFVMGLGIGLAFASMVNVIVESVRPDQTGVATGMNVIFRNVGGSLGGQISASILTASVVVGGLPTEGSFVNAFWLSAAMLLLGFAAALLVPKRAVAPSPVPAEQGQVLDAV